MTSIAQVLRDARALIDTPDKWVKGYNERDGCMCVLGAIAKVLRSRNVIPDWEYSESAEMAKFLPAGFRQIDDFNDHPTTTHADVMALFDRAIAAAELETQS